MTPDHVDRSAISGTKLKRMQSTTFGAGEGDAGMHFSCLEAPEESNDVLFRMEPVFGQATFFGLTSCFWVQPLMILGKTDSETDWFPFWFQRASPPK